MYRKREAHSRYRKREAHSRYRKREAHSRHEVYVCLSVWLKLAKLNKPSLRFTLYLITPFLLIVSLHYDYP